MNDHIDLSTGKLTHLDCATSAPAQCPLAGAAIFGEIRVRAGGTLEGHWECQGGTRGDRRTKRGHSEDTHRHQHALVGRTWLACK
jgi:hypothetical protein